MEIYKVPIYIRKNGHWDFVKFIYVEADDQQGAFQAACEAAKHIQSD